MDKIKQFDWILHTDHGDKVFTVIRVPIKEDDPYIVCEDNDGKLYTFDVNECVKIRL